MMKKDITAYSIFSTIAVTMVGIGIFSYPRELSNSVGSAGWVVVLVAGAINCGVLYLIYKMVEKNNFSSFLDILKNNFGKIIGTLVALFFVLFNISFMAFGLRGFIEVIKMYLLQRTPTEFLIMITIFCGLYLIRGNFSTLIRYNEIAFWLMFIPLLFILIIRLKGVDFTNMMPSFDSKPIEYFVALQRSACDYVGILIIFLIFPKITRRKEAFKSGVKSVVFITAFYAILTIFVVGAFNKFQTGELIWPTINMIKSIDIPGGFIERWDGVVMAIWIIFYFSSFVNVYFFSADLVKNMFRLEDVRISSLVIMPFIYILSLFPQNIGELHDMSEITMRGFYVIGLVIVPILVLIVGKLKGIRSDRNV